MKIKIFKALSLLVCITIFAPTAPTAIFAAQNDVGCGYVIPLENEGNPAPPGNPGAGRGDPADIPSAWAEEAVNAAITAGIVPEELRKQYKTAISRKNFCRLAFETLQKRGFSLMQPDADYPNPFTDCASDYVYTLNKLGIIDGHGNGIFAPDEMIKRQEAAKILSNMADILKMPRSEAYPDYEDMNTASDWARLFISNVYSLGIMLGSEDNKFNPLGVYTSEQSIITCLRIYYNTI